MYKKNYFPNGSFFLSIQISFTEDCHRIFIYQWMRLINDLVNKIRINIEGSSVVLKYRTFS